MRSSSVGSAVRTIMLALTLSSHTAGALAAQSALPKPLIRDSAGIRIVEYPGLAPLPAPGSSARPNPLQLHLNQVRPAFRMEARPFMELGGLRDNEEEEFNTRTPIYNVLALSNGTVVVNDFAHLKFYSKDGRFLRIAGRRGRGPGEFTQIRELCHLRGDTILVVDLIDERISIWDKDGKNVRTHARQGDVVNGSCRTDGTVVTLVASAGDGSTQTGGAERFAEHQLIRPNGTMVRTLGSLPAPAADGAMFRTPAIVPRDSTLIVGSARTFEYRTQSFDGRVRQIVRFGVPGALITDAEWAERSARTVPNNVKGKEREDRIAFWKARKPKGREPAFSGIRVDPAGRIWVQDYNSQGGFTIFDTNGILIGRFSVPGYGLVPHAQLAGVGNDYIALVDADANGAVRIRLHRITLSR
jgi:hypothetical protein